MEGMSSMVPMIPGLKSGVPIAGRVGVDEADDLDAKLAALVQLASEADARLARADHQQPLPGTDALEHPAECQPPADDGQSGEHGGNREDAAAENQVGERVIEDGQNQRGGAERLEDADQQLAMIDGQPRIVVQIAVVETQLTDVGDEQRFRAARCPGR